MPAFSALRHSGTLCCHTLILTLNFLVAVVNTLNIKTYSSFFKKKG